MIPRSSRLPKTRIGYLLKKGKKLTNEFLVVKYLPAGLHSGKSHFAVIISLKTEAKAVRRNRLRRQIYEIIRLNHGLFKGPIDLIFIVKPALTGKPYGKIEEILVTIIKKLSE